MGLGWAVAGSLSLPDDCSDWSIVLDGSLIVFKLADCAD